MDDSDWTDIVLGNNIIENDLSSSCIRENITACKDVDQVDENIIEEKPLASSNLPMNKRQENECCPICLCSFTDRSFLDQCFHILLNKYLF